MDQLFLKKVAKKLKEKIPGGLGRGRPDSDFDKEQLSVGIQTEMKEHTLDREMAKEIAKDHLSEVENYYITDKGEERLDLLEQEAEKELENK
jgi:hypothetical protein